MELLAAKVEASQVVGLLGRYRIRLIGPAANSSITYRPSAQNLARFSPLSSGFAAFEGLTESESAAVVSLHHSADSPIYSPDEPRDIWACSAGGHVNHEHKRRCGLSHPIVGFWSVPPAAVLLRAVQVHLDRGERQLHYWSSTRRLPREKRQITGVGRRAPPEPTPLGVLFLVALRALSRRIAARFLMAIDTSARGRRRIMKRSLLPCFHARLCRLRVARSPSCGGRAPEVP